jgi:hypothetical protein
MCNQLQYSIAHLISVVAYVHVETRAHIEAREARR